VMPEIRAFLRLVDCIRMFRMRLRAGQISDWGVGLQILSGRNVTAKTRRARRKTRRNALFATDRNQMHTDGNANCIGFYLCASDFYLWPKFIFASFFALLASWRLNLILILALIVCAGRVFGDEAGGVPFYYGVGSQFEGQVTTLVVGVNENAGQAVRSRDGKYASLNVDTSLFNSAGVRRFRYQKSELGFVGSEMAAQGEPASAGNGLTPSIAASPSEIAPPVSVLDKRGMVLVMPLER
jgi:hypothetical protein